MTNQFTDCVEQRLSRKRQYRVILRKCESPASDKVQAIIRESMTDLGFTPKGKVLIKPNVVTANRGYIHHSYTDPALVAQTAKLIQGGGAGNITIGESGGFGIPSRLFFYESGYSKLDPSVARLVDFNLEPTVEQPLTRGMHHKHMAVAKSLYEADTLVWMPKLKYHICCTITCALKLNVGILTHKQRMLYHDDRLDEKIVDLLEIGYPDLVITDAIEVGTGFESAPRSMHMGVMIIADDPVAMDVVACRALGYEPEQCAHLMEAIKRGYGPKDLDQIKVEGDISLDELREKTRDIQSEYQDIHKVNTSIRFYCGNEPTRDRLCHGGCLAAVKGCLGTIDKRRPGSVAKAKPGAIVTGVYNGDVDAKGGVALLIGDCTKVNGRITARKVVRVGGCPIGAKQLFFKIPNCFALPNPTLDFRDGFLFVLFSIDKLLRKIFVALFAKKPALKS